MSCAFTDTISNSYEKWDTYNLVNNLHLCVFLWFQTYDGNPPSSQCHEYIVIRLHDLKDSSSSFSKFFPSLDANCDGGFGSSSSSFASGVPSFCSTSASWFASYFKIDNSYLSSSISLSFFWPFFA